MKSQDSEFYIKIKNIRDIIGEIVKITLPSNRPHSPFESKPLSALSTTTSFPYVLTHVAHDIFPSNIDFAAKTSKLNQTNLPFLEWYPKPLIAPPP